MHNVRYISIQVRYTDILCDALGTMIVPNAEVRHHNLLLVIGSTLKAKAARYSTRLPAGANINQACSPSSFAPRTWLMACMVKMQSSLMQVLVSLAADLSTRLSVPDKLRMQLPTPCVLFIAVILTFPFCPLSVLSLRAGSWKELSRSASLRLAISSDWSTYSRQINRVKRI